MAELQFFPIPKSTVNIVAGVGTANVALPGQPSGDNTIQIVNSGTVPVFIAFGKTSAITASITLDMPILGGEVWIGRLPWDFTYVAAITGSSTATIYFTVGKGN